MQSFAARSGRAAAPQRPRERARAPPQSARGLPRYLQRAPAGQPLPQPLRRDMEQRFGEPLGGVRVHADCQRRGLGRRDGRACLHAPARRGLRRRRLRPAVARRPRPAGARADACAAAAPPRQRRAAQRGRRRCARGRQRRRCGRARSAAERAACAGPAATDGAADADCSRCSPTCWTTRWAWPATWAAPSPVPAKRRSMPAVRRWRRWAKRWAAPRWRWWNAWRRSWRRSCAKGRWPGCASASPRPSTAWPAG